MAAALEAGPTAWRVRPLSEDDIPAALQLAQDVYGRPAREAWYRWKVLSAPGSEGIRTAWVAEDANGLIAHYAATPLRLQLNGRVYAAAHGCDIMTAPAYRRRGVLSTVAAAAHEHWANAGLHCIIGLPTASWGGLRERIGCQPGPRLGWLWRPLRPDALLHGGAARADNPATRAARLLATPPVAAWNRFWDGAIDRAAARPRDTGRKVRVEAVTHADTVFDELWDRVGLAQGVAIVRDAAWVGYRFADAPAEPGAEHHILLALRGSVPAGYLVYRLLGSPAGTSGWIIDILTAPGDQPARASLVRAAVAAMRSAGARDVRTFAVADSMLERSFRGAGLVRRRGTYDACFIPLTAELASEAHDCRNRIYVTAGDFDVV
ncbi:MAG: GNAT family N-acetyltransferase [Gemmatimonadota bacterium]